MRNKITSKYRYAVVLLRQLVKTDFKLRYQNSFLGYVWSLLKPLALFVIMYWVFVRVIKVDYGVKNSGAYLLLGLVMWTFFIELTGGSVASIVGKGDLLRKLSFPKYILVVSPAVSALINMGINFLVAMIFILVGDHQIGWQVVVVPLLIMQLFVFSLSIGLFLSATYVRLRDIGYVWDVVMQLLFYATPIFFPLDFAPPWAQKLLILSPLAQSIQDLRYELISRNTPTITSVYGGNSLVRLVPIVITVGMLVVCGTYFKRRSQYFAEEI